MSTIGVNLTASLAVETAAIQTKPACAGYKTIDFWLVRVGGLCFYRRVSEAGRDSVHSIRPRLRLTPMYAYGRLRDRQCHYLVR